jgi:3-oxoacyl-[acyl-carrier protein] reductase
VSAAGRETPVALVTGSSTGIGRHLAGHLLGKGWRVVGCARHEAEWSADGYMHEVVDVTDEPAVEALLRRIAQREGRLDAALNCAGAATMNHALLTPASTVTALALTNVVGAFIVSREAARLMRRRRFGRIVNVSSVAVPMRLAGQSAYVASKAAIERASQVLAVELAPFGITVNVVAPPPVDTAMIRGVPKEKIAQLVAALPIRRLGTMADIANVVDFFLRPASDAVTGQIVGLGGLPAG